MKQKHKIAHMKAAYVYAQLSTCKLRQVGCIIVKNNTPIAVGYNGTNPGEDNCCEDDTGASKPGVIHAEDNALRKLTCSQESAWESSVFVTTAPCKLCASRLIAAGVSEVYYDDVYKNADGIALLTSKGVNVTHLHIDSN